MVMLKMIYGWGGMCSMMGTSTNLVVAGLLGKYKYKKLKWREQCKAYMEVVSLVWSRISSISKTPQTIIIFFNVINIFGHFHYYYL